MKQNNFFVLPFYTSTEQQQRNAPQAYGKAWALVANKDVFLPFQIRSKHIAEDVGILSATLHYLDRTTQSVDVKAMLESGMQIIQDGDDNVFIFNGATTPAEGISIGQCYIEIIDNDLNPYISEVMTLVDNTDGYITLAWRDRENLKVGDKKIIYDGVDYTNILYLCTQIGMPEYQYTEEGETRDGRFFPIRQISNKVYKMTFVAPEYICDALRLVPLSDEVVITDADGSEYVCENILITPKWLEQGNLAQVDVEIYTDTIVKKIAKGYISPLT